jgi:hypothetical protein
LLGLKFLFFARVLLRLQVLLSLRFLVCSNRPACHRATDHKSASKSEGSQGDLPAAALACDNASEEYIVLVCHQNVIRYFACRALQLPPEAWLRFRGNNCGVTEIIVTDDGRVSLDKFADVGHLPLGMHTFH